MFKRGEVYKSLHTIVRNDLDFIEPQELLFEKDRIYRCEADGTLHSVDTCKNEPIDERLKDNFVLVGHYTPKKSIQQMNVESMRNAYEKCMRDNSAFNVFIDMYGNEFKRLVAENDNVDDRTVTYTDGSKGDYWSDWRVGIDKRK